MWLVRGKVDTTNLCKHVEGHWDVVLPWRPGFPWSLPAPLTTQVRQPVSCSGRSCPRCRTSWASRWSTPRWCSNRLLQTSALWHHRERQRERKYSTNQKQTTAGTVAEETAGGDNHLASFIFIMSTIIITTIITWPLTDLSRNTTVKWRRVTCSNTYIRLIWGKRKENTPQVKAWTNLMNTTLSGCQNKSWSPSTTDLKISTFSALTRGQIEEKWSERWLFCLPGSRSSRFPLCCIYAD